MRSKIAMVTLALAGCAAAPANPPATDPASACRNDALAGFVGQPATSEVGAQMLAASGARALRWVTPGMAVTMDYRFDRLTVHLDANNRIESANCG